MAEDADVLTNISAHLLDVKKDFVLRGLFKGQSEGSVNEHMERFVCKMLYPLIMNTTVHLYTQVRYEFAFKFQLSK